MLKSSKGMTEIEGSKINLFAEYAVLTRSLLQKEIFNMDDINECIKLAQMSDEELNKETLESFMELIKELGEMWRND